MATDFDGNTLAPGDKVWIPATVNSVTTLNVNLTTAYSAVTFNIQGNATRKPRSFPDAP